MAKLINILAASVGGGLMLGAGIRLGEALVGREPAASRNPEIDGKLAARLGALEDRLLHLEGAPGPSIEKQAAEVEAIRSELAVGEGKLEALSEISLQLRSELQGWLENSVALRMADVESKLKAESERSQREMLDAFAESVQTRVMHRIARLEAEVSGQSGAMTELRECSLRTEEGMQKLLGGLERLMIGQQPPSAARPEEATGTADVTAGVTAETPAPVEEPKAPVEPPPFAEPRPKPRRWSIFG